MSKFILRSQRTYLSNMLKKTYFILVYLVPPRNKYFELLPKAPSPRPLPVSALVPTEILALQPAASK